MGIKLGIMGTIRHLHDKSGDEPTEPVQLITRSHVKYGFLGFFDDFLEFIKWRHIILGPEGSLFTASKFIFKNSFSLLETRTPVLQVLKGTNMAILLQFHWEVQLIKDRQIFIAWLSIVRRREKKLHH